MSRKIIFAINIIVVLVLVNWSVYTKEQQLRSDNIVYLELAPVDPRSLMQGDYMRLRYALAGDVEKQLKVTQEPTKDKAFAKLANSDGKVSVTLDKKRVAKFKALVSDAISANDNEAILQYRVRNGRAKFASNEFFFQEGKAEQYENAKYAKFVVADNGEVLLVDLLDNL